MAEVKCPKCGRVGRVTEQYVAMGGPLPGAVIDRMDGLDPEKRDGCVEALHEAGFTVAAFGPRGPRSVSESVASVRVKPPQAAERVAAEIKHRLEGRLDARVEAIGDRVLVRTMVNSPAEAETARATVEDVAQGVRQTLGLDALDQGENRITIRVE